MYIKSILKNSVIVTYKCYKIWKISKSESQNCNDQSFNLITYFCFQCVLLGVRTIHVMLRYAIHLYDTRGAGTSSLRSWDKRGPLAYYTELASELTVLAVEFLHHIHMLLWSNIFLSMASLVICMQLRYLFYEIQRRITKHRNYLAVLSHMEQKWVLFILKYLDKILRTIN